jgi:hypothetical protein
MRITPHGRCRPYFIQSARLCCKNLSEVALPPREALLKRPRQTAQQSPYAEKEHRLDQTPVTARAVLYA